MKQGRIEELFHRCDISSIAFFRIAFGIIVGYDVLSYIFNEGWIYSFWISDIYRFKFHPFTFLEPLGGNGMYILFGFMAFLCICITIGFIYRLAMALFFLSFSYMFLLEETTYLNHTYLIVLLSFIMIFVPASKAYSIDALIFKKMKSNTIEVWNLWLLRFTVGLPYFFGGIAKMKSDWIMGEPMRTWLSRKTDFPILGSLFQEESVILFMSWSGLLLDLLIIPALLWKKTRIPAFIFICMFHILNSQLFVIAIFPWFMIAASTIYFEPDWFRKLITRNKSISPGLTPSRSHSGIKHKLILGGLSIWIAFHCIIPFRHLWLPGNVLWNDQGYYFSWHMMMKDKEPSGTFFIRSKSSGEEKQIAHEDYLTPFQVKKVFTSPKLIWEFTNIIKDIYAGIGFDVSVHADIKVAFNGRLEQQFTNPEIDIASQPNPLWNHAHWIMKAPE